MFWNQLQRFGSSMSGVLSSTLNKWNWNLSSNFLWNFFEDIIWMYGGWPQKFKNFLDYYNIIIN
jgi:hypothetical protein